MNANLVTVTGLPGNVVSKTGPLFLGALFHWGLFGVLCTQVFIYSSAFQHDPPRNKIFVYGIFILEVVQTILLTKSYFDVFGSGFGDPASYDRTGAIWFSVPFLSGIVAFLAELFYALRIHLLSESYWVPVVIMTLAVIQLGGAVSCALVIKNGHLFSQLPAAAFAITSAIWTAGSALCDAVIATSMTRYLWERRAVGTKTTQMLVKRIIRLVLETGIITAVIAVLLLILTVLPNHVSYYQVPAAILAKIYSNSMMALLNSRINLSSDRIFDAHTERQLAELSFKSSSSVDPTISIMTTREVVVTSEGDQRFSYPKSPAMDSEIWQAN